MSCPTHEALIGYAAGDLDAPELQSVETHLSTDCPSCSAELVTIADLRAAATSNALEFPPLAVLERASRIPLDHRKPGVSSLFGRLASLVFDTDLEPVPQGARSTAASSRQLLFRALDYDIDVRVAERAPSDVRVSGQILPGPERPMESVAGVEIVLIRDGRAVGVCSASELGEFDFGTVPSADYSLSVETDEDRIVVERLSANHR